MIKKFNTKVVLENYEKIIQKYSGLAFGEVSIKFTFHENQICKTEIFCNEIEKLKLLEKEITKK